MMNARSLRAWVLLLSLAVPAARANTGIIDRLTPSPAPSDAPSDVPSAAPSARPPCAHQTATAKKCLAKLEDGGEACDACVASALKGLGPLEPDLVDCDTFSTTMCSAIETCDCGDCGFRLERFLDCSAGHKLGCELVCGSGAPTTAPVAGTTTEPSAAAVTAAPTPMGTDVCTSETKAAQNCLENKLSDGGAACDKCVATALQGLGPLEPDLIDCDTFSQVMCSALDTCDCGECVDKLENFLDCGPGGKISCELDCGAFTPAPTPTLAPAAAATSAPTSCSSSQEDLQTCFADKLGGDTGCDSCLATTLHDLGIIEGVSEGDVNCTDYENYVCLALESCPCGDCAADAKTYLNCNISPKIGCSLSCVNNTCPVTPGDIQTCFAREVFNPTCSGCLAPLLGNLTEGAGLNMSDISSLGNITDILGGALEGTVGGDFNCSTYQAQACDILSACDCGSCFGDVGTYLDCTIGDATGCYLNGCNHTLDPATEAPASAPTSSSCEAIAAEAITCLANLGDIGQVCNTCVAGGIPTDANDCTSFEASVCSTLAGCDCGDCAGVVEKYLDCSLDAKVGCPIAC